MNHRSLLIICMLAGCLLLVSVSAQALQSAVPETGQTVTYATGDDGALRPGTPWPTPRFTANNNGTVTDNLTGLIWLQNANCSATLGGIVKTSRLTWVNALTWSNSLGSGFCGLTDNSSAGQWRLPTRLELKSLIDASITVPSLPVGHPFSAVQPDFYWSSTTYAGSNFQAWFVSAFGDVLNMPKSSVNYVWPVRGGQFGNSVISVSPSSVSYGNVAVGGISQTVTISNTAASGSSSLQINAITLRGTAPSQFSINPGNGSGGTCGSTTPILNPGSSCTFTISFTPTIAGSKSATLRVSGSDVNAPNIDIPLTGSINGYNVTASVSGGNGSIASINPVSVVSGAPASFTLAPSATYQPASTVSGTCPTGAFSGNTYTTGTITSNCTVGFTFTNITYPLTVTFAGTGSGSVIITPKPPAIDCTGTCSQSFDSGTLVTLTPTANASSVFSGWSNCPSISGDLCTVTMGAAKFLTVSFSPLTEVGLKVGSTSYGTVAEAISVVGNGGEISLKTGNIYESLNFNSAVTFTLKGGFNSDFQTQAGTTTINGSITITAGTAIIDGIAIK